MNKEIGMLHEEGVHLAKTLRNVIFNYLSIVKKSYLKVREEKKRNIVTHRVVNFNKKNKGKLSGMYICKIQLIGKSQVIDYPAAHILTDTRFLNCFSGQDGALIASLAKHSSMAQQSMLHSMDLENDQIVLRDNLNGTLQTISLSDVPNKKHLLNLISPEQSFMIGYFFAEREKTRASKKED